MRVPRIVASRPWEEVRIAAHTWDFLVVVDERTSVVHVVVGYTRVALEDDDHFEEHIDLDQSDR
jgi:hypothetical protein